MNRRSHSLSAGPTEVTKNLFARGPVLRVGITAPLGSPLPDSPSSVSPLAHCLGPLDLHSQHPYRGFGSCQMATSFVLLLTVRARRDGARLLGVGLELSARRGAFGWGAVTSLGRLQAREQLTGCGAIVSPSSVRRSGPSQFLVWWSRRRWTRAFQASGPTVDRPAHNPWGRPRYRDPRRIPGRSTAGAGRRTFGASS